MTHYDLTSDKDAHHQCAYAKMDCSRNFATRIHRYSLTAAQHPKLFSVNSDARTTLEIYGHVAHREAVEKVASVLPGLSSQTGGDLLARNSSGRRKPYPH